MKNRGLGKKVENKKMKKKKQISKKIFKVVKNRVLGKKVEKKKAKYFCRKQFIIFKPYCATSK